LPGENPYGRERGLKMAISSFVSGHRKIKYSFKRTTSKSMAQNIHNLKASTQGAEEFWLAND
jgi:hypothetical protein